MQIKKKKNLVNPDYLECGECRFKKTKTKKLGECRLFGTGECSFFFFFTLVVANCLELGECRLMLDECRLVWNLVNRDWNLVNADSLELGECRLFGTW